MKRTETEGKTIREKDIPVKIMIGVYYRLGDDGTVVYDKASMYEEVAHKIKNLPEGRVKK